MEYELGKALENINAKLDLLVKKEYPELFPDEEKPLKKG